ncbi:MAG: hypothetical protein M0P99_00035 [Candidatus Cloacimonetes bacterium]|jgi:hypothetical protein|nr:hypothetical protein [Candidatus Cloacimonadota bacterium]
MNDILLNIISIVVTAVIVPLISLLGTKLIQWIGTKIKDEKAAAFLSKASEIVLSAVKSVFQTYVDSLKKSGDFDAEAQKTALNKATVIIKSQLGTELIDYIKKNYGDLDAWISTQVESTIDTLKNA